MMPRLKVRYSDMFFNGGLFALIGISIVSSLHPEWRTVLLILAAIAAVFTPIISQRSYEPDRDDSRPQSVMTADKVKVDLNDDNEKETFSVGEAIAPLVADATRWQDRSDAYSTLINQIKKQTTKGGKSYGEGVDGFSVTLNIINIYTAQSNTPLEKKTVSKTDFGGSYDLGRLYEGSMGIH